jgi:eukaryotic-like serine/threonine-protein kinase
MRRDETAVRRPPPPPPPWWRENWWIWLVALVIVVLGGLLIALAYPSDDETTTTIGTTEELVAVPRVVGLSEERAVGRLEGAGFDVDVERDRAEAPEGQVFAQDPEPGSRQEEGSTVTIRVAESAPETVTVTETTPTETEPEESATVQVPDAVGQEHFIAAADVEQFGLVADTHPVDSTEAQGIVVAQSPAPGTELREGETVRLNVSLGDAPRPDVTVPDVTGPSAAEARTACREAGLTCRTVYRSAPSQEEVGEVLDQRPAAGTVVPLLTQLTLFVGR